MASLCRFSGVGSRGLRLVATAAGTRGLSWGASGSLNASLVLPRMTVSSLSRSLQGTLETKALFEENRSRLYVLTPNRFAPSSQFGGSRLAFSSAAEGGQGGQRSQGGQGEEDVFKAVLKFFLFVIPLPFFALVGASLIRGWQERTQWIPVEAEILPHGASLLPVEQQERQDGDPISSNYVTFRYRIANRQLQKTQIRSPFWVKVTELLGEERTYNAGDKVTVRCMREDPSFTVLDPLIFSWWTTSRDKYDKIAQFADGRPPPALQRHEMKKRKEEATAKRNATPFVGRTRPPSAPGSAAAPKKEGEKESA